VPSAWGFPAAEVGTVPVVVTGLAVVVVELEEVEVVEPAVARVVLADAVVVVVAWAPVVVVLAVVGTGTTGVGPRPVHTVVVVVGGRGRVVEVLVKVCGTATASVVEVVFLASVVGVVVGVVVPGTELGGGRFACGLVVFVERTDWGAGPAVFVWPRALLMLATGEAGFEVVELARAVVLVGRSVWPLAALGGALGWREGVGLDAASSLEARAEISLLCLEMRPSSRAISLWSWARVARGGRVVAGAGSPPARLCSLLWRAWAALLT